MLKFGLLVCVFVIYLTNIVVKSEIIRYCGPNDELEQNSTRCSGVGTYSCNNRNCTCNEGYGGQYCECSAEQGRDVVSDAQCKMEGSDILCSGQGTCSCGACECHQTYFGTFIFGRFCECNNMGCPRRNGELCGGDGLCQCGICKCRPGYTGETCDCNTSNDACIAPADIGGVCRGHGTCQCGSCVCESGYNGQFCQNTASN